MPNEFKGLHRLRKGKAEPPEFYYYAWRGGPRLTAPFGTSAFAAQFAAAHNIEKVENLRSVTSLVRRYTLDPAAWGNKLADKTRYDYKFYLAVIAEELGDMTFEELEKTGSRAFLKTWRNEMAAERGTRIADLHFAMLRRLISWAIDNEEMERHPILKVEPLHSGSRKDMIWEEADQAKFLAAADPQMAIAFRLAAETGQRRKDLIEATWSQYDGEFLDITQSKTGVRVLVPIQRTMRDFLRAEKARQEEWWEKHPDRVRYDNILLARSREPWTGSGFASTWYTLKTKLGFEHLTFHDLRGTAVTRLVGLGLSDAKIAAITGHSLSSVKTILDKHYFHRDKSLSREIGAVLQAAEDRRESIAKASGVTRVDTLPALTHSREAEEPIDVQFEIVNQPL